MNVAAPTPLRFEQLVFSGGGIRCFWHGGFLSVAGPALDLQPKRISGVSGGVLSGAAWIGQREERLLEVMSTAFAKNESNFEAEASNFTPHQEIYRQVVRDTLDQEAIDRIACGPVFQATLSVPPQWLPPRLFVIAAGLAYQGEQALFSQPHLRWARRIGLRPMRVDARQAARDGRLVDLVCAAATIPPVFDVPEWDGKRVLDGGMCDKAPPPHPDRGPTLFLMTRRYRNLPQDPSRLYIQPSRAVAADKIDFSEEAKVEETWAQGEEDGRRWLETGRTAG